MRSWKKIITAMIILALAGGAYGWYQYQKAPPDIRKQEGVEIAAVNLLKEFQENETAANAKYVDKVLVVTGTVTGVQTDSSGQATVYLQTNDLLSAVTCSFYKDDEGVKNIKTGATARVKGVCTGMLSDIVLNKCSLAD
jgi:hypothetical protein